MHKNGSTSFVDRLRADFHNNPINMRVVLPDGSLAVVKRVHETDGGRVYKVQGIHPNGRFRALQGVSCWYSADELQLHYYTARAVAA
jgi:hypothetical protein